MIFLQYFVFRDRIRLWSIGWVFKVVFGCRNTSSTAFKPSIIGCAGQLSTIRITLRYSFSDFSLSSFTHWSKWKLHPTFHLQSITTWKAFDLFKVPWFRRFTNYKYWKLLSSSTCSCHSNQSNFILFTTTTFLAFHVQGFLGKSLIGKVKFIGDVYVLQFVSSYNCRQRCFIPCICHFSSD